MLPSEYVFGEEYYLVLYRIKYKRQDAVRKFVRRVVVYPFTQNPVGTKAEQDNIITSTLSRTAHRTPQDFENSILFTDIA